MLKMVAFGRSDLMQTTGRIIDIARNHDVSTIYIDEVGLGAGVIDRAKEIGGVQAVGINGGSRPSDTERYLNLRAQMFDGLRQRFADGDIAIPDDAELISQLASLTFKYTSRGQLQLESKDQIRSSGRQSPDKADALALAFTSAPNPMRMWVLSSNTTQGGRRRRRGEAPRLDRGLGLMAAGVVGPPRIPLLEGDLCRTAVFPPLREATRPPPLSGGD